jgi:hypothetical protein
MSFNPFSSGMGTQVVYPYQTKRRSDNGGNTKKISVSPSGKYCSICNEMVGNGDPDGEDVPESNGKKRRHKSCVKRLAFLQSKNTESCKTANL